MVTPALTCLPGREGESHDVIQCPRVQVMWWVEGQVSAGPPAQIHQVRCVHHGNGVATQALPVSDRDVLRGALVVTLVTDRNRTDQLKMVMLVKQY